MATDLVTDEADVILKKNEYGATDWVADEADVILKKNAKDICFIRSYPLLTNRSKAWNSQGNFIFWQRIFSG